MQDFRGSKVVNTTGKLGNSHIFLGSIHSWCLTEDSVYIITLFLLCLARSAHSAKTSGKLSYLLSILWLGNGELMGKNGTLIQWLDTCLTLTLCDVQSCVCMIVPVTYHFVPCLELLQSWPDSLLNLVSYKGHKKYVLSIPITFQL